MAEGRVERVFVPVRDGARLATTLYLPAEQLIVSAQTLILRTSAPLAAVAGLVREHVRAVVSSNIWASASRTGN